MKTINSKLLLNDNKCDIIRYRMKNGFDNDKYLKIQSEHIKERIAKFGDKLYLEFGGKLFDDYHASRVLPGFQPDSKLRMLMQLADVAEIVIVISAVDIEKNKVRSDLGITYDKDVLRLRDAFQNRGLMVGSIVIIASDEGFGKNDYIETSRPLVVITAPGPGSGKMATCLSQLYHENKRGIKAGYAKFETFPIWNLPLKHPVNLAYEAATADLNDVNMIDPWHLEAYGKTTVNYNRDIEIFPVLDAIFKGIYGKNPYKSPTDMGVNMAGYCIVDDTVCCEACKQEIIRRYYETVGRLVEGNAEESEVEKINLLMQQAGVTTDDRKVTVAAKERAAKSKSICAAIELADGTIITSETTELLGTSAALILNATKHLAGLDHKLKLIPKEMIEPIQKMKVDYLSGNNPRLHTDEVLVALAMLSKTDENCHKAIEQLPNLRGCQVHTTVMLSEVDRKIFKKLGVVLTCEPVSKKQKPLIG